MYKALLLAYDGDWVTDHERETVDEVIEAVADQGSRWFFYPIQCVITSTTGGYQTRDALYRKRIVACPEPWEDFTGKTVSSFIRHIKELALVV